MSPPDVPMPTAGGPTPIVHALSVDVEDYRQILSSRFRGEPGPVTAEFERNMEAVLALLGGAGATATFFVTGTVAERRPDLVRRWAALGHEIASHGWDHTPIWAMAPARLKEELACAKRVLEDAIGRTVAGYRAPIFSVRWDTLWALDVIRDAGFAYDSSIVPVRTKRYGIDGFDETPRLYALASGREIVEIPLSTARVAGRCIPMAGGGYFRLFSYRRIRRAVAAAERGSAAFVVYCHPDEFGPARFRAVDLATGWQDRLTALIISARSNWGRQRVPETVRQLLAEFRFAPLAPLAERVGAGRTGVRLEGVP
jgi:polysaccharide deacetylase family protein (PEP-CTERM system associated)